MTQSNEAINIFDPTGMLKSMRDSNVEAWSKMMVQLVNTAPYAEATGAMLDAWLSSSTPFKKALETTMAQVLANFNMPVRSEITRLAERLTNIEMRLDDLDARLDQVLRAARKVAGPTPEPSKEECPQ